MFWIIFYFFCFSSLSALLTTYKNAKFQPSNIYFILDNITQVYSQMNCACLCFNNVKCLTANYFGVTQDCILFITPLAQGTLILMTVDEMASVLTFPNKTLPASSTLTNVSETIFGIWNTTAGHSSYPSSVGYSTSDYPPGQGPQQAFDGNTATKYVSFGVCNSTVPANMTVCGQNTGLYLSPQQGSSLLLGFRFCTPDSYPERDPILVTVEGSNQPSAALTLGSSWTLIYNGLSGLSIDPGRYTCGITQWLSINSIWYTSYRILIESKRSVGNFVQYSELQLFSY